MLIRSLGRLDQGWRGPIPVSPALEAYAFPLGHRGSDRRWATVQLRSGTTLHCDLGPLVWKPSTVVLGCFTFQQHASISQGRICFDNCACCHTEKGVADQTCYLTKSQITDTGPASPNAHSITLDAGRAATEVPIVMPLARIDLEKKKKKHVGKAGFELRSATCLADTLPQGHRGGTF